MVAGRRDRFLESPGRLRGAVVEDSHGVVRGRRPLVVDAGGQPHERPARTRVVRQPTLRGEALAPGAQPGPECRVQSLAAPRQLAALAAQARIADQEEEEDPRHGQQQEGEQPGEHGARLAGVQQDVVGADGHGGQVDRRQRQGQ